MSEGANGFVKVAAVQAAPISFDLPKSLQKLSGLSAEAASKGAQIVVFPEGFLTAYPWRYAFDATIGAREPRGLCRHYFPRYSHSDWYARYYESAVGIPSPECDFLAEVAKSNQIYLSVGIIEKDQGTLYCTALLLGKDGTILSRHRKLIPTAAERLVWGRGAGDGLNVVQTELGKIGGLICWENYMPAARLALYQQGIDHGGSCVVGPLGTFLAEPVWDREEIVYATLRSMDIVEARLDFDPVGSYARPDVL
ncbi:putative bifunctional nitrilase/nitrile hydratase NIT4B [Rhizodiscina lignyota]|uniref:Bifunctional nitrilase/nitrile hydratase NIT4B n=1 Tax=Rhizodiscina lignyota TaxID=1504668 RepID=A0A9P4INF8_9PEZI|nr:putative bifunctional nitrilase/nitrile hydratase NIT4B [Rhizodiscina lignyota]